MVPTRESVEMAGGKVRCAGTILYADIAQSDFLLDDFQQKIVVKLMKCFLRCSSLLVARNRGEVTGFDGSRVMGIFVGEHQENRAVRTALQINSVMTDILVPRLNEYFRSSELSPYNIAHCVGIERGDFLAVRADHPGANDLIWVGRAPSLATKLSTLREKSAKTVVTSAVYDALDPDQLLSREPFATVWEARHLRFLGQEWTVYSSAAHGLFESATVNSGGDVKAAI